MDAPGPESNDDRAALFVQPLHVTLADRIALTASYDQCVALTMQLFSTDDLRVRTALLEQSLPRLAVTGLTTLGGLVSYLAHPDTSVKHEVREILLASSFAGRYPEPGHTPRDDR